MTSENAIEHVRTGAAGHRFGHMGLFKSQSRAGIALFRLRERLRRARRWWRYRRINHRCYKCGLLGRYDRADDSRALKDLKQVAPSDRARWAWQLRMAREDKRLTRRTEFDPTYGPDLGIDEGAAFGVECGVGQPQGPHTAWFVDRGGRYPDGRTWEQDAYRQKGAFIREHGPGAPPLGRLVAVAQSFVWPLVRPHDCKSFVRHQPGYTPREHLARRDRWRQRLIGAGITLLVQLVVVVVVRMLS